MEELAAYGGKPRSATLNVIAEDKRMVLYRPALAEFLDSVTAAIFLSQAFYWWERVGQRPYYKFNKKCKHDKYEKGDSWCEELGFKIRAFNSAREKVSVKKSKETSLDNAVKQARKEEKPIVYWTNSGHVTYYMIIEDVMESILERAYSKSQTTKRKTGDEPNYDSSNGKGSQTTKRKTARDAELQNVNQLNHDSSIRISEITTEITNTENNLHGKNCAQRLSSCLNAFNSQEVESPTLTDLYDAIEKYACLNLNRKNKTIRQQLEEMRTKYGITPSSIADFVEWWKETSWKWKESPGVSYPKFKDIYEDWPNFTKNGTPSTEIIDYGPLLTPEIRAEMNRDKKRKDAVGDT